MISARPSQAQQADSPPLLASQLKKHYRGQPKPALQEFSISLDPGEIFGLLGPNGAGKTTAISIMTSLIRADQGSVIICGENLKHASRKARRRFGLVPQDIALYSQLTARENLSYFGRLYGLRGAGLSEMVEQTLNLAGLNRHEHVRISRFSGGMKRRANLAAGILHTPKLLFLDEPTVGIDAQSRQMLLEKLAELGQQGMSMVYTTHYMEEAEAICHRVAVMDEGRIIVQGRPEELISQYPDCPSLGDLFIYLTGKNLRD